ncbi:hypothetical protein ACFL2R_03930, partial [Patescibacteria group bacterium]
IFPSEKFSLNTKNINSSENNVSEIKINQDSIVFNASSGEPFSRAEIKINKNTDSESPEISIKKSYEAFMYPESEPITDLGENEINSLIQKGDSVYIFGNGKYYPIDRPETFESAGFKWENIEESKDINLGNYEKQKLFNYKSVHPNGTVFKATDSGKLYFILNEKRHKIQGELLKNPEINKQAIEVRENISTKSCQVKKGTIRKNNFLCHIPLEEIQSESGKDYKITITNINSLATKKIETKFIKELNKHNLKSGVKNIINKIKLRYKSDEESK